MYSLKSFQPYADVLDKQEDLKEQMEQARATVKDGQTRLEDLDADAVKLAAAGPDGYQKYQKDREELQLQMAQAQEQGRVLEAALVLIEKETAVQRKAAQAVIKKRAREEHAPIVERAAAALDELAAAFSEEQELIEKLRPAVGPETGLPLLVGVLPVRAAQLYHSLERIRGRG